ncbi:unnamed protein product [Rotaria magnacalcarata]
MSRHGSRRGGGFQSRNNRGRFSPATHGNRNPNDRIDPERDQHHEATDDDDEDDRDEIPRPDNVALNTTNPRLTMPERFSNPRSVKPMYGPSHVEERFAHQRPLYYNNRSLMNVQRSTVDQTFRNPSPMRSTSSYRVTESKETVEKRLAEIIANYCSNNEYVSVHNVIKNLFASYKVSKWSDLNINNVIDPYKDLKPLFNLCLRHSQLNLFVDVFQHIRIVRTLDELNQEILNHFEINSYDEFQLGPILKHPTIEKLFNLRNTSTLIPTKSTDIIELFHKYTRQLKYKEQADFEAFKDHAAKKLGVEQWNDLSVHVTSFAYLLKTCRAIKSGGNIQNLRWTKKIEEIEIELCQQKLDKIKTKFETALSDYNCQAYVNMTPVDVFHRLLEIVEEDMGFLDDEDQKYLLDLLNTLKNNELYQSLLNLAIFLGTVKEPKEYISNIASSQLTVQTPTSPSPESTVNHNKLSQQQSKVPLNKLCTSLYKLINESNGLFHMSTLIEIQREICQQYKINDPHDFTLLGHGDFIKFLCNHQKTIDNNLEFYLFNVDSCGGIKRTELYTFVQHLFDNDINDQKNIEKVIKYHFNLQNLKQIGFYNIEQLCNRVKKQTQSQNKILTIQYEEILLGNEYLNTLDTTIHRPFVHDDAHLCEYLSSCPLLVDIKSWSHWNRLYMQEKGSIKEFLHRNKAKLSNMIWLEVSNNNTKFIRLSNNSNIKNFENDLMNSHLQKAAAHLLSLAMQERDSARLPIARLQTIMKTWFTQLKKLNMTHDPIEQILNFLSFLPFPFSSSIIKRLILEPAEQIFPDFKSTIWKLAKHNLPLKLHLEELGLTIGIDEWTQCLYSEVTYLLQNTSDETSIQTITIEDKHSELIIPRKTEPNETSSNMVSTSEPQRSMVFSHPVIDGELADNNIEPFEHIKQIREALGKNTDSNDENHEVVDNLQDLLGECLKKLAGDLYSEQGHFVLELIQNADDNDYSDFTNEVIPKLKFIINDKHITIYNNEKGFQKQNIKAICAVGKSTKGKHKEGYCGHKGIGFKSVFVVSDTPEIHSNNYHIGFDAADRDHVGYVCPIWRNEYQPILECEDNYTWNTCIRLNLKPDKDTQEQIKQKFDSIDPKLLLFLHRLKSLEIDYENYYKKIFTRYDHPQNIVELVENNSKCEQNNYWLVIKKTLSIPETLQQKLREIKSDTVSTSVAIGFPLQSIEQCLRTNTPPPFQNLFAFLPVRSYGFRFILQADFEIPASRQDILNGNEWNEWLRDEMSQLLPDAYDSFNKLPTILKDIPSASSYFQSMDSIQALKYFLKFIPITNEVDKYFHGFIQRCLTELREKIKFPTRKDNSEEEIEWQLASKCVIVRDPFILKILSSNILSKYCGKYFLHEYLYDIDEKILLLLGMEKLNIHEIIKIIKKQFLIQKEANDGSIEQISQWLMCVNYCLEQMKYLDNNEDDTIELKELKIIPIENQTKLVSTNEMKIFFPDTKQINFTDVDEKFIRLLNDLPTVKLELFDYIERNHVDRLEEIKELLKKFGIIEKRHGEIYGLLIKPIFENESKWKTKESETLMMYLLYVYENIYQKGYQHNKDFDMDDFKTIVQIKCQNNEFYNPMKKTIHLSLTDTSDGTISKIFNTNNSTYMSDDYLNYIKPQEKNQWFMFLEKLGISEFFKIETILYSK